MNYKDLLERTVASGVQAMIAALGTNSVMDLGIDQIDLIVMAGVTAALAVVKVWTASVLPFGDKTPSLITAPVKKKAPAKKK